MKNYLDQLNEKQLEAVRTTSGPLLILAGAGAGKTKTLTHRILHLIHSGVSPEQILAITFTNKAAREMRDRITFLIENDPALQQPISQDTLPYATTFHSLGVRILRAHSDKLAVTKNFSILDRTDSLRLVKEAIMRAQYNPKEHTPTKILSLISKEKGKNNSYSRFQEYSTRDYFSNVLAEIWNYYEIIKTENNSLDFDDLLLKTAEILRKYEDIRTYYQNTWKYIHIDEYQDTNEVQNEIAILLTGEEHNICAVGDIDQNIYSWRGARIQHILEFETIFPKTKLVILEQNYRSTQNILEAANQIIEKNVHRKEKRLFTNNTQGDKLSFEILNTENDEARFVAQTCRSLISDGVNPNHIAVLYRANFQSRSLEEAFLRSNVPYQVLGVRFFERKEVKDILSFIRVSLNPDSISDLKRIINVPPRGIGKVTLGYIVSKTEEKLSPAMRQRVADFKSLLTTIREKSTSEKPSELIRFVMDKTGIETYLKHESEEGLEKLENSKELVTLATKYDDYEPSEGIQKLLEDAALATDQDSLDKPRDGVKLMTIHAAKGLEFEYVFITGLEQDLFPHTRDENLSPEEAEEERRLFYVALTRAKKKLYLTYAAVRTIFGEQKINLPSEFLGDIDENLFETAEIPKYKRGEGGLLGWPGDDEPTIAF